jgi:hypothetical protein
MLDSFGISALMEERKLERGHPVDVAAKTLQSLDEMSSVTGKRRLAQSDTQ